MILNVTVYGVPIPQGSMKGFVSNGWKRAVLTSDNKKTRPWKQEIVGEIMRFGQRDPVEGPVSLKLTFWMPRPKRLLKRIDPPHIVRPDLDKLVRAVCDALTTAKVYRDDAQVNSIHAQKRYIEPCGSPRVQIEVLAELDVAG